MLRWALIFFVLALVAAVLGFGGLAGGLASIAEVLFWLFAIIFIASLVMGLVTGAKTTA